MAFDLKGAPRGRLKFSKKRRNITKENAGQLLNMQNFPYCN
jgi:hypothetical protein